MYHPRRDANPERQIILVNSRAILLIRNCTVSMEHCPSVLYSVTMSSICINHIIFRCYIFDVLDSGVWRKLSESQTQNLGVWHLARHLGLPSTSKDVYRT